MIDSEHFSRVKIRTYFIEKEKYHVVKLWVEQFNRLNSFCKTSILASKNSKQRQERFSFWCDVLREILNDNNFFSVNSLFLALDNFRQSPKVIFLLFSFFIFYILYFLFFIIYFSKFSLFFIIFYFLFFIIFCFSYFSNFFFFFTI